jgi:hypothetical protein
MYSGHEIAFAHKVFYEPVAFVLLNILSFVCLVCCHRIELPNVDGQGLECSQITLT